MELEIVYLVGIFCLIAGLVSFGVLLAVAAKKNEWWGAIAGGVLALGICFLILSLPTLIMEM